MDPIKKHKRVPFDDWPSLLAYLSKVRSMLKEVERLGVFNLINTVSNITAITDKMPSDMVRKWMDYSNDLPDRQQGAAFDKFITEEWKYATAVVLRTMSAKCALKTMGVGGGGSSGGGQHHQGTNHGSKNNNQSNRRNGNGGNGHNQVPVTPAQPSGGRAARLCSGLHLWWLESQVAPILNSSVIKSQLVRGVAVAALEAAATAAATAATVVAAVAAVAAKRPAEEAKRPAEEAKARAQ
jgi:hypothetical protein